MTKVSIRRVSGLLVSSVFLASAQAGTLSAQNASDSADGAFGQRLEELIDRLVEQIEPGMSELRALIEDWSAWHAPEVLPNGDILIRRRRAPGHAPESAPPDAEPPLAEPPLAEPPVTEPFEL